MLKLNKKILVILSILVSLNIYANDNADMKFINKLYQNKEYKLTVEELNKFIVKYPSSRHYDNAQFLLGHSLYEMKEYEKAGKVFHKLINTNYNNEAYYYLALTSIYQNYLHLPIFCLVQSIWHLHFLLIQMHILAQHYLDK